METLYWQYPQTAGDLPFGTVVGRNIMAPLHDHLSGAAPFLLTTMHQIRVPLDVLHTNFLHTLALDRDPAFCRLLATSGLAQPGITPPLAHIKAYMSTVCVAVEQDGRWI